jgi:hypothetical protein
LSATVSAVRLAIVRSDGLVGRWRLDSYIARHEDGSVAYPLGEAASGSLVYTAGGWMSGHLAAGERPSLITNDVLSGAEAERAAAFSTYVAYCGPYTLEGDTVIHHVTMSLFPNWVATEQTRIVELAGDELLLRTEPTQFGGEIVVAELRWIREE